MDQIAAAEERLVADRLRRKLEEANVAAKAQLSEIQDHVSFNLQKAYFKCAYECFDRSRRQEEISGCAERCSIPVVNANNLIQSEMAKFQERMNRSLMVCRDKSEAAKIRQIKTGATDELLSCVSNAIEESIQVLPHVVDHLKASLSII